MYWPGCRLYRPLAAVVGICGGGGVRPGDGRQGRAGPEGRERAKSLLWAAGKLADYAVPLGLEAVPEVLLHPSVAERFTRCAPGLSGAARRTLRTNLRFIGRRVVPQFYPADVATFMTAAGISCSQRLGDLAAGLEQAGKAAAVRLLGAARRP